MSDNSQIASQIAPWEQPTYRALATDPKAFRVNPAISFDDAVAQFFTAQAKAPFEGDGNPARVVSVPWWPYPVSPIYIDPSFAEHGQVLAAFGAPSGDPPGPNGGIWTVILFAGSDGDVWAIKRYIISKSDWGILVPLGAALLAAWALPAATGGSAATAGLSAEEYASAFGTYYSPATAAAAGSGGWVSGEALVDAGQSTVINAADGSVIYSDQFGTAIQGADGSWTYMDPEGGISAVTDPSGVVYSVGNDGTQYWFKDGNLVYSTDAVGNPLSSVSSAPSSTPPSAKPPSAPPSAPNLPTASAGSFLSDPAALLKTIGSVAGTAATISNLTNKPKPVTTAPAVVSSGSNPLAVLSSVPFWVWGAAAGAIVLVTSRGKRK